MRHSPTHGRARRSYESSTLARNQICGLPQELDAERRLPKLIDEGDAGLGLAYDVGCACVPRTDICGAQVRPFRKDAAAALNSSAKRLAFTLLSGVLGTLLLPSSLFRLRSRFFERSQARHDLFEFDHLNAQTQNALRSSQFDRGWRSGVDH